VISEGHARALAAIPDKQAMIEAYKMILREGGSVRRAEELARRFKKSMHRSKPSDGFDTKTVNEFIDSMAMDLQKSIGDNAHVKMRRSRVETAIHIVLKGNPQETETQIQKIHDALVGYSEPQPFPPGPVLPIPDEEVTVPETESPSTYINPFEPIFDPAPSAPIPDTPPSEPDNFPDY
jgi:hypothetical protein